MKIVPDFRRLNTGENFSRRLELDSEKTVSGNKCVLTFITPMGKIYITDEIPLSSGKGEYILPSLLLDGKGVLLCQMSVSGENGYLIKSEICEFPVYASCDTEEHPAADDKSIKSLAAIFSLIENKSDRGHDHNGLYYLKEETDELLSRKSDTGHTHSFEGLENSPGQVFYDSVIFSSDSFPETEETTEPAGRILSISHDVKSVPFDSVFYLKLRIGNGASSMIYTCRYIKDAASVPDGELFLAFDADVSYKQFYSKGFPEKAGDNALVVHLKTDGTGSIITKNDLAGTALTLEGHDRICERYVTLPLQAIEHTQKAAANEKKLITSGGVYDAVTNHNSDEAAHQDIRNQLSEKSDITHNHNSEYYSRSAVDSLLEQKQDAASMEAALGALIDEIVIPTKVSELANDADYIDRSVFDRELSEVKRSFVITATGDVVNKTVTNVSRSFDEIAQAYNRKDHIFLDIDMSQIASGQRALMNLVSFLPTQYAIFEGVLNTDGPIHVAVSVTSANSSSAVFTPLASASQIGDINAVLDSINGEAI